MERIKWVGWTKLVVWMEGTEWMEWIKLHN